MDSAPVLFGTAETFVTVGALMRGSSLRTLRDLKF